MKDEFVAWLNGRPVTRGELRAAFDLVADPTDWKNPINAVVDPDEQTKVRCVAVEFFFNLSAERDTCTFELLTAKGAMSPIQAERCNSARSL